ncbi:MAG: hypothetical protein ACLUQ6_05700 [Alistipes onderdonkii]
MLPQSLLGPVVGVYVDRWDRKRTMILADSFIAFCTLILAVLFWFDVAQMWHIYILLACRSRRSAFHTPSMQASVPLPGSRSPADPGGGLSSPDHQFAVEHHRPGIGSRAHQLHGHRQYPASGRRGRSSSPAPRCCSYASPIPCGARSNLILWRSSAKGSVPCTPYRACGWFFTLAILVWFFIMPVGVMFPLMTLQHFGGNTYDMSLIEIVWGGGALIGGAIMGHASTG